MPAPQVEVRPSLPRAVLLVRYIAGRFVLGWIQTVFVSKYLVLGSAALFISGFELGRWGEGVRFERDTVDLGFGAAFLLLFVVLAVVQWVASRAVRRVGAVDKLAELDDVAFDAVFDWWPNLRVEARRVGLDPSARSMLKLGATYATRRLSPEQSAALQQVNWLAVLPREQLHEAHHILTQAAPPRSG